jgi:hypothetical protein
MSESTNFPALFESLEDEKPQLDFLNLGISVTSMEDVFLRSVVRFQKTPHNNSLKAKVNTVITFTVLFS